MPASPNSNEKLNNSKYIPEKYNGLPMLSPKIDNNQREINKCNNPILRDTLYNGLNNECFRNGITILNMIIPYSANNKGLFIYKAYCPERYNAFTPKY